MEDIANLITNVGFPIACCIVLFWNNSNFSKTLNELNITLKGIMVRLENIEDRVEGKN